MYYDYRTLFNAMHDVTLKNGALYRCIDEGMIFDLPTADVRENVKANLVIAGYKRNGSTQWFECSVCGGAVDFTDNFCKHCGAEIMRGGKSE